MSQPVTQFLTDWVLKCKPELTWPRCARIRRKGGIAPGFRIESDVRSPESPSGLSWRTVIRNDAAYNLPLGWTIRNQQRAGLWVGSLFQVCSRQKTKATSKRQIEDGYKAADGVALP